MRNLPAVLMFLASAPSLAAPVTYTLLADHTHPSFETDHFGGLSIWRGFFKEANGTVVIDSAAKSGTVKITVATASIDLPNDELNKHAASAEILDVSKYPMATYEGALGGFASGVPTTITGTLTLHGISKPLHLKINSFKCAMHPMLKKEVCGADAIGTFNRADFGITFGQNYGFKMETLLRIQAEGVKAE